MAAIDPRLEAEYNNRAKVPNHPDVMAGWKARAQDLRARHANAELDLAYGTAPRHRVDVFWPGAARDAPLAVFIHGGYWQALDKSWFSHLARGFNARGVALALPSYRLCPDVPLAAIIDDIKAALDFLMRRYERDVVVTGHSAGGHLTAMALATDCAVRGARHRPVGGLAISGLFDLRPLVSTSINGALGLDEAEAWRLSPAALPKPPAPLVAYVGALEGAEYERQSATIASVWAGEWRPIAGADHFTAIAPLEDGGSEMIATVLRLFGR